MMLRRLLRLMVMTFLFAAASSCATLGQEELREAALARHQAAEVLSSFARVLARDDVEAAMSLVSPAFGEPHRAKLERMLRNATWLELYTGYRLDAEGAVNRESARAWLSNEVELTALALNARNVRFKDEFTLARTSEGWLLTDFCLKQPIPGESVDLPQEDKEDVRKKVKWLIEQLKDNRPERVFASLPKDASSRLRKAPRSFWDKLFGASAPVYRISDDLYAMLRFDIQDWPDPDRYLPTAYVSATEVLVLYDIAYVWPGRAVSREDNLRMEIFLRKKQGKWEYHLLKLYASDIPGSQ